MAINDATVKVGADTTALDSKVKGMKKNFSSLGSSIIGAFAGIRAATGAVRALGDAVKNTISFNRGMAEARTIAHMSTAEFKNLKKEVLDMGAEFGQTTEALTKGLYDALSAGVPKGNVIDFLRVANKAAIAGVTDTGIAVDGLTTVMNAFGMTVDETQKIADNMFQIVRDGKITFPELAENISKVAPLAKAAGLSFDEMSAAIATAVKVEKPERAMTAIRAALVEVTRQGKDLIQTARDMSGASLQTILDAGFSKRSAQGIALLSGNVELLETELKNMADTTGNTDKALGIMLDDSSVKIAQLQAQWDKLAITLTDKFVPALNMVVEGLNALLSAKQPVENFLRTMVDTLADSQIANALFIGYVAKGAKSVGLGTQGTETAAITDKDVEEEALKLEKKRTGATLTAQRDAERKKENARQADMKFTADYLSVIDEINNKELKAEAKLKDAQEKRFASTMQAIKNQIEVETLRSKGLNKEAHIREQILNLQESMGGTLTKEQEQAITAQAGALFDLQQGKPELGDISKGPQATQALSDSLLRIGGSTGGVNTAMNLDKKRNDLIGKLVKLYEKDDNGLSQGEVMI